MVNKTIGNYLGADLLTDFSLVVAVSVWFSDYKFQTHSNFLPL